MPRSAIINWALLFVTTCLEVIVLFASDDERLTGVVLVLVVTILVRQRQREQRR